MLGKGEYSTKGVRKSDIEINIKKLTKRFPQKKMGSGKLANLD